MKICVYPVIRFLLQGYIPNRDNTRTSSSPSGIKSTQSEQYFIICPSKRRIPPASFLGICTYYHCGRSCYLVHPLIGLQWPFVSLVRGKKKTFSS